MISAINSALAGLHTASQKLDGAARDIVRAGTVENPVFAPPAGGTPPPDTGAITASFAGLDDAGLVDGLVALKEAEILFKASATLIGALNRTEGEVLDILS